VGRRCRVRVAALEEMVVKSYSRYGAEAVALRFRVSEARPFDELRAGSGAPNSAALEANPATREPGITIDLGAVKQNSKSRKTGVSTVDIALSNVEKAQLIPEI
jgi:hypothetical protein